MATKSFSFLGRIRFTVGDDADDRVTGGAGVDLIFGGGGDDIVDGGHGNDILDGGDGRDVLRGGSGHDVLHGGAGGGVAVGPGEEPVYDPALEFTEQLYGGAGNDWLDGGAGEDSLFGESGNDVIHAGDGHDYATGGAGNDLIYGGEGLDQLYGDDGNDVIVDRSNPVAGHGEGLYGGRGNDLLVAGDGAHVLIGGDGRDVMTGGAGNDLFVGGDAVSVNRIITGGNPDGDVDRFIFRDLEGNDTIYGFQTGRNGDLIDLSQMTIVDSLDDLYIGNGGDTDGDGQDETIIGLYADEANGVYQSIRLMNISHLDFQAVAADHILF